MLAHIFAYLAGFALLHVYFSILLGFQPKNHIYKFKKKKLPFFSEKKSKFRFYLVQVFKLMYLMYSKQF